MPDEQRLNLADYERAAASRIAPPDWAYIAGGAADGWSLGENRRAYERWLLRPRVLRDVSNVVTRTTLAGIDSAMPVALAPTAMHRLAVEEGEVATARAAKAAGIPQVLSTMASRSLEDIAATGVDLLFQLYVFPDRGATERLVARAEAAGAKALMLTVDVPVLSLRENLIRAGFDSAYPLPNLEPGVATLLEGVRGFDPSLTWNDVDWLRSLTSMPIWVKGVLRADDALAALDHGVQGIVVSNHGARQLDGTIAPLDALPEIAGAVGDHAEVWVDGGVRRGTDVIKALALGAQAVLLGRPQLHGLAVDGQAGLEHLLSLLANELTNGMAQCGAPTIDSIERDLVTRGYD